MTPSDNLDPEGNPIHYTHPWEETPPGTDADEPAPTLSPHEPRLIPIHPADVITANSLREEYAATLNLRKPDPDIPSAYSSDPPEVATSERKRGGQPGNLNALKHGLYLDGRRIKNATPVELAQLYDVTDLINRIKQYMAYTYDYGMRSRDLREINETMRALSLAAMSLTRLSEMHRNSVTTYVDNDIKINSRTDIPSLIAQYQKKLEPYLDLIKED